MKINILIFGHLTDLLGASEIMLNDLHDSNNLIEFLNNQYPELRNQKYAIAINKKIINTNTLITEGSTVVLLPPFSGG